MKSKAMWKQATHSCMVSHANLFRILSRVRLAILNNFEASIIDSLEQITQEGKVPAHRKGRRGQDLPLSLTHQLLISIHITEACTNLMPALDRPSKPASKRGARLRSCHNYMKYKRRASPTPQKPKALPFAPWYDWTNLTPTASSSLPTTALFHLAFVCSIIGP